MKFLALKRARARNVRVGKPIGLHQRSGAIGLLLRGTDSASGNAHHKSDAWVGYRHFRNDPGTLTLADQANAFWIDDAAAGSEEWARALHMTGGVIPQRKTAFFASRLPN